IEWFTKNGCKTNEHKFGYRSIHYIIETKPTKQIYYAEIQVRTIFEEAWSEIDHTVRYPYNQDNTILGQLLMILNRLAGGADEMGTFIQILKGNLEEREHEFADTLRKKDSLIRELETKIKASKIEKEEQENLVQGLSKLKFSEVSFKKT